MSSRKWVTPSQKQASTGLDLDRAKPHKPELEGVLVSQSTVFDMNKLKDAEVEAIDKLAGISKISSNHIRTGMIVHILKNGAARQVENQGFSIAFQLEANIELTQEQSSLGIKFDADSKILEVPVDSVTKKIKATAMGFYEGIKIADNSASGTKLMMRINANLAYNILATAPKSISEMKDMNKIAVKINLGVPLDFLIGTQAFLDLPYVSRADSRRFLIIMSIYMRRQRGGKNKSDVNGKEVNVREIWESLATRMMQVHKDVGTISSAELESIWLNPDLIKSEKGDGGSYFYNEKGGNITLASVIRNLVA
jgi:hypothetical protein